MWKLYASIKNYQGIFRRTAALKVSKKPKINIFNRVPFKVTLMQI